MEIINVKEGRTITYSKEGGEIILCPVCSAIWWWDIEEKQGPCQHLKFVFYTYDYPAFVFTADSFNGDNFITEMESLVESISADTDNTIAPDDAIFNFIRNAQVVDLTMALVYKYIPDPPGLTRLLTVYGYSL